MLRYTLFLIVITSSVVTWSCITDSESDETGPILKVEGMVFSPDGSPLKGAVVTIWLTRYDLLYLRDSTFTDAAGNYKIQSPPHETCLLVRTRPDGTPIPAGDASVSVKHSDYESFPGYIKGLECWATVQVIDFRFQRAKSNKLNL